MKTLALLLTAAFLALAGAEAADAHRYAKPRYAAQESLEARISTWRVNHGLSATYPTVATLLASIAIQQANYQEAIYSKRIEDAPFAAWSAQFFGTRLRGIILTSHCHGDRYRARTAFRAIMSNSASRAIVSFPVWLGVSVRAVYTHQHKGYYRHRGRCAPYYVLFAEGLIR